MRSVLIGTAAYRSTFNDVDLIANQEFVKSIPAQPREKNTNSRGDHYVFDLEKKIVEIVVPNTETAYHQVLYSDHQIEKQILGLTVKVCQPKILAALKKAHLVAHHKWEHHIYEYTHLKKLLGVEVFTPKEWGSEIEEIFKLHRKEIQEGVKYPKLNVKKDYFFEDAEFKIFDHDTVHQVVALGPQPAYTLMQDGEIWCSKKKWNALTEQQKLSCVIEEACVLALERSIIPSLYLNYRFRGAKWAYEFALSKISTTITSGWFREYAIEHYWQAANSRPDYVNAFFDGLKKGVVKVLKPEIVTGSVLTTE